MVFFLKKVNCDNNEIAITLHFEYLKNTVMNQAYNSLKGSWGELKFC